MRRDLNRVCVIELRDVLFVSKLDKLGILIIGSELNCGRINGIITAIALK
jgi:hypothetical protein